MRREDEHRTLELRLRSLEQLFNSMDPSPFLEKDLDTDAEAFIRDWAAEPHQRGRRLRIRVQLEQVPSPAEAVRVAGDAIRHFFGYQAEVERGVFRHFVRDAQLSLAIGLAFITACVSVATLVPVRPDAPLLHAVSESLIVAGWVGMWRPIQMLLYDWWPIRRRIGVFERLARVEVDVAPEAEAESP